MRVIRTKTKPRPWSWGIFIAAVPLVLWYKWTETVPWWMILGCCVLSLVADAVIYGTARERVIGTEKE